MILLVCGGRDYSDHERVWSTLDALHVETPVTLLIQGGAEGADRLALAWASNRGVQCCTYHANWSTLGRAAGPVRNMHMLIDGRPDIVLAFPGGRGTENMIGQARERNVEVRRV